MSRTKPYESKPIKGGRLMSAISAELPGINNYKTKRDWRRYKDREIRSEGYVRFCPAIFDGGIPMPDTDGEDITLVFELVHPNGRTALIVACPSTVFRYTGTDDPLYVVDDYVDPDYVDSDPVAWKTVGSGFTTDARRWEAEMINGYLTLNNGVDLPQSYRVNEDVLIPVYELREQAVASVGTIAQLNAIIILSDVRQLTQDAFDLIFTPIDGAADASQTGIATVPITTLFKVNSGVAGVEGHILTATNALFNSGAGFVGMEGTVVRLINGMQQTITSVTDATHAVLDGDVFVAEPDMPLLLPGANDYRITPNAATLFPDEDVTTLVGRKIWWSTSQMREVVKVDGGFIYGQDDTPIAAAAVKLENSRSYAPVTDTTKYDRIQYRQTWSMPELPRRFGAVFKATVTPTTEVITLDYPIKSVSDTGDSILLTGFKTGNLSAAVAWNNGLYMLLTDLPGTETPPDPIYIPGRPVHNFYAPVFNDVLLAQQGVAIASAVLSGTQGTLSAAQTTLAAAQAAAAAAPDDTALAQAVSDASAAVDTARGAVNVAQANLTTAKATLATAESKLTESESVLGALLDSVGSIVGFSDLQNDGSAILKCTRIRGILVVQTETDLFLQQYTAATTAPFNWQIVEIPQSAQLYYRNTPILVNNNFILYATRNSILSFDLSTQFPAEVLEFQDCYNLFFDQANGENNERIFTCDNSITKEIYLVFPSMTDDKAIRYDYAFQPPHYGYAFTQNTNPIPSCSTTSMVITAGARVGQPGGKEEWFVMGGTGVLWKYGLIATDIRRNWGVASKVGDTVTTILPKFDVADIGKTLKFADGRRFGITLFVSTTVVKVCGVGDVSASAFDIEPSCTHRDGTAYTSTIISGDEAFGSETAEKLLNRYEPLFSSFSPNTPVAVSLYARRNLNETPEEITDTVYPPETLMAPVLVGTYLGDKLVVDGINNPCELTGRAFEFDPMNTGGFARRVT